MTQRRRPAIGGQQQFSPDFFCLIFLLHRVDGGPDAQWEQLFIQEQPLQRNVQWFLVYKAHSLLYHSTLGVRVLKKKKEGRITHL